MGEVIAFNRKRLFTLEEARKLLRVIRRVTNHSYIEVQRKSVALSYIEDPLKKADLEESIVKIFQDWRAKIRKLGCEGKGMWLVDFDSGDGYYCWQYPEENIEYFHGYYEGYRGRVKVQ